MSAGLRGLLSGASIIGHPIDTVGGYPRVVQSDTLGLLTELAPGYRVAGDAPQRARQATRLCALKEVAGGDAMLRRLAHEPLSRTLEVVGARLEERLPIAASPELSRWPTEDEARALCTQLALVCGKVPPEQDYLISLREASTEWARALALLEHMRIEFRKLPLNIGAIDEAIYNGCAVISTLAPGALLREAAMVAIIAILVDLGDGTLARLVVDAAGTLHLLDATSFTFAPSAAAVITQQMFEPTFPPLSVSRTFEPA